MNTERTHRVLVFIRQYIAEKGYSPSIREIMEGTNISSPFVVSEYLAELENQGAIRRTAGIARSIVVLRSGP